MDAPGDIPVWHMRQDIDLVRLAVLAHVLMILLALPNIGNDSLGRGHALLPAFEPSIPPGIEIPLALAPEPHGRFLDIHQPKCARPLHRQINQCLGIAGRTLHRAVQGSRLARMLLAHPGEIPDARIGLPSEPLGNAPKNPDRISRRIAGRYILASPCALRPLPGVGIAQGALDCRTRRAIGIVICPIAFARQCALEVLRQLLG